MHNRRVILERFSPPVREWFASTFAEPTAPQRDGWPAIISGRDTLICAPTGSGKTLTAFLWSVDALVRRAQEGTLSDETHVIYVSPLKALGNDIEKNLDGPLRRIRELAAGLGAPVPEIRVAVRSGDTPAAQRDLMVRKPPHILITTPESLYILLTAERSRRCLSTARVVIVDEIHAVAASKRGAHLALSLERLDALAHRRLQRIGLSATQRPIEEVARLLIGAGRDLSDGSPDCAIVDSGHRRDWDLSVWVPGQPLGPIASHELRAEVLDHIAELVTQHRTTLVFVNTRRLVERISHQLTERLGQGRVAAHHGSLSRALRLTAERGLKSGEIPVVVATASLELGIDIGQVDLVCHLGAPRAIATMLQRVGRSGHAVMGTPKGVLLPLTRDELLQCAACVEAARAGELDELTLPDKPLDVLAQHLVAECAARQVGEEELWALVRRAYEYRNLDRSEFEDVLAMLSDGVATSRGRRSAWLHFDRVNHVLRGRRGARLAAITCGGAIPDNADYDVIEDPTETFVGKVNEDFAIESMEGNVFLLGNTSWRIRRVEPGRVRVTDAHGQPPTVPFWLGEAPARTSALSEAVSRLRQRVADSSRDGGSAGERRRQEMLAALESECGLSPEGAEQLLDYVRETLAVLGTVPTRKRIIAERFFDEAGGMQLVLHAPFGGAINRAWGLGLRKRFCVSFDFELQAAATDDGVVLSLGQQHSFPLESTFSFLRSGNALSSLEQAVLRAPVFGTRFRWNASCALALLRQEKGRRVPTPLQRMRAEDLMAAIFPAQLACQDNAPGGPLVPPDHPIVTQTLRDCLHEWMDADGLLEVLRAVEAGEIETVAVETPQPSQMSHEILNANPYAFLDDAPLEERRARAVALRRLDPELDAGLGALSPEAIAEVREQASADIRDPDELHDHLLSVVLHPLAETVGVGTGETASSPPSLREMADELMASGRAAIVSWKVDGEATPQQALVAAERLALVRTLLPEAAVAPNITPPQGRGSDAPVDEEEALRSVVQGWLEQAGPTTAEELAGRLGLPGRAVERSLALLEGLGVAMRGRFTPGAQSEEWCDRRLLARIHRLTLRQLRREIEAVSAADFMRFLLRWQHVQPGSQLHGRDGVLAVIHQLQGLELPAPAWESDVFRARVARYNPDDLDYLCISGLVTWGRLTADEDAPVPTPLPGLLAPLPALLTPPGAFATGDLRQGNGHPGAGPRQRPAVRLKPTRSTPITFLLREQLALLAPPRTVAAALDGLSTAARQVVRHLEERGASFAGDIERATRRLPSEVEDALWELVSAGLVTGDGVAGLRRLVGEGSAIVRAPRLATHHRNRPLLQRPPRPPAAGRWALWRVDAEAVSEQERHEAVAQQLLRRYGVVFRELLARERHLPPWRVLLAIYRRWEARQDIRGGRFVSGFVGEQFALPQAVEALRGVRRAPQDGEKLVLVSAADPLNLVGIVLPGERVPIHSGGHIAYEKGTVLHAGPLGEIRARQSSRQSSLSELVPGEQSLPQGNELRENTQTVATY